MSEIHDHITTPEGMAAWNRLNDVDVAIRSALAEAIAQAMNDEAFVVCDLGTWSAFKGKRLLYRGYSENKARRALVSASRSGSLIHRSALAEDTARAAEGQVPEGWKLVPVEPTDRMTFVGQSVRYNYEWGIGAIYRHMLAAAPALPLDKEAADANR